MITLLISQPKVNRSSPPPTQPLTLPADFLEQYQQWLQHRGLNPHQAHWWGVWVQRFRAFRRQESSPRSFHDALTAFLGYQQTQFNTQPWQLDQVRKAILEMAAWWRTYRLSATPNLAHSQTPEYARPPAKEPLSAETAAILRQVRTELRLRHYALFARRLDATRLRRPCLKS